MKQDKPIEEDSDGHRFIMQYKRNNLYVVLTDNSFDITGTSEDVNIKTDVAFGIINRLITRLIEDETDLEDIAGMIWSESRKKGDLADIVSKSIEKGIALE
jgi:hypothetical protein